MDLNRQLYRSDTNKILFGVCGGLGEYFNIDPNHYPTALGCIRLFRNGTDRLSDRSTDHAVKTGWSILNQQKSFV